MKNMQMHKLGGVQHRFDSNETIFFARELETIDPVNYMELFAGLRAKVLFPEVEGIDPLDKAYTYRMWSIQGQARVGGPNSNDSGTVSIAAKEVTQPIKDIDVEYGWTVDDIKRAAKTGAPLDQLTIQAAMSIVARKQETMIAFGEPGTLITGMLNNAAVDGTTVPVTKTGGGTAWTTAAKASELLADINLIVNTTRQRLKQASKMPGGDITPAFDRFVVLLPSFHYGLVNSTPRSDNSDTTVLQYALQNNRFIESIEEWWELDTANAGSPMIMCYPRNAMWGGWIGPRTFDSQNPQEHGKNIVIPATGNCGGGCIRYPVAASYLKTV